MNLYLLEQDVNRKYGTYNAFILTAKSKEVAKLMHPDGTLFKNVSEFNKYSVDDWARQDEVTIKYLGKATPSLNTLPVILTSYLPNMYGER